MQLRLEVIRDGETSTSRTHLFPPGGEPVVIGRSAERAVPLEDDHVSRKHCSIAHGPPPAGVEGPPGWWLVDLGSRSGTTLNENEVDRPILLRAGDLLRLGRSKLRVELGPFDPAGRTCPGCARSASEAPGPGIHHGRRWVCQACLLGEGRERTAGEYLTVADLGSGSNGKVVLAAGKQGERLVALKLTQRDPFGDEEAEREALARFRREVRILRTVDHPHVVRVYAAGTTHDGYWVALELLETDLLELVRREGPLPLPRALEVGEALLLGLAHVHARGIMHRDVKPSNVLLDAGGAARLGDFGLCTGTGDTQLTGTRTALGTLYYTAPEQVEDAHRVDPRADVYGWGATMYHALAGIPPYSWARSFPDVVRALLQEALPPLGSVRPDLPRGVDELVMRALEKDPARRFASAMEAARALRALAR